MQTGTVRKLRALITGGDDRNITKSAHEVLDVVTHVQSYTRVFPSIAKADYDVIVILPRWGVKRNSDHAKELGNELGIPVIVARTGNYIVPELLKSPTLKARVEAILAANRNGHDAKKANGNGQEAPVPKSPEPETEVGLSLAELREKYLPRLSDSCEELMKPGEALKEEDFLPLLVEDVGLSEKDVRRLMPYLAVEGVLDEIGEGYWVLLSPTVDMDEIKKAVEVRIEKDKAKAAKKKAAGPRERAKARTAAMVAMGRGLPEGPYPSRSSIARELLKYREFSKEDGTSFTLSRGEQLVHRMIKEGIVVGQDGEFRVKRDESVRLTLRDESPKDDIFDGIGKPEPKNGAPAPAEEPLPELPPEGELRDAFMDWLRTHRPDLAAKYEPPKKEHTPDRLRFLKGSLGPIMRNQHMKVVDTLRQMMHPQHWDEMSQTAIKGRLLKAGHPNEELPRDLFTEEEWNLLAWETLRKMPLETVAPHLLISYEDVELECVECDTRFVFTAGEQEFFLRKFGEITHPKRCYDCRKNKYTDSFAERILRRHGG